MASSHHPSPVRMVWCDFLHTCVERIAHPWYIVVAVLSIDETGYLIRMETFDWKIAEEKLKSLMGGGSKLDPYMAMNILVPLRNRLDSGERSVRLYNRIMSLNARALMDGTVFPRRAPSEKSPQPTLPTNPQA